MQFVISTEWLEEVKYPLHHKDQAVTYYCALLDIEVVIARCKSIKDYPYLLVRISWQADGYGTNKSWKYEALDLHNRKVQMEFFASDILILNQQVTSEEVFDTFVQLRKANKQRLNGSTILGVDECI